MKVFFISLFQGVLILFLSTSIQAQNIFDSIHRLSLQEQEPFPLNYPEICAQISYPPSAAQHGIEGLVQVWVKVDSEGRYCGHEVVGKSHALLASALNPHLRCLSFTPAFHKGKAVAGWKALAFRFRLSNTGESNRHLEGSRFICPEPPAKDSFPVSVGNVQIE